MHFAEVKNNEYLQKKSQKMHLNNGNFHGINLLLLGYQ